MSSLPERAWQNKNLKYPIDIEFAWPVKCSNCAKPEAITWRLTSGIPRCVSYMICHYSLIWYTCIHFRLTNGWMFLRKCRSFGDKKCLDSRGTWTPTFGPLPKALPFELPWQDICYPMFRNTDPGDIAQGCHGQGKVGEIPIFRRVRKKSEFCCKSGDFVICYQSQGISFVVPIDAYFSSFGEFYFFL